MLREEEEEVAMIVDLPLVLSSADDPATECRLLQGRGRNLSGGVPVWNLKTNSAVGT